MLQKDIKVLAIQQVYYEDQNQNVTDYVYKHNMGLPYVHESSYPTSLFLPVMKKHR